MLVMFEEIYIDRRLPDHWLCIVIQRCLIPISDCFPPFLRKGNIDDFPPYGKAKLIQDVHASSTLSQKQKLRETSSVICAF